MGNTLEFDAANNVIRSTWKGPLTDEIFIEEVARARKLMASRPGLRGIADFSGVAMENLSSETIQRLAWVPTQGEEER